MSSKGKAKNMAIKLLSTAGTGYFYVTSKNPRTVTTKLQLKKVMIFMFYIIHTISYLNSIQTFV